MNRPILSVEHKGPIPRAYVLVGGYTREGAQSNAKAVSRILRERLPTAHVIPPTFLKFDPGTGKHVFRVIVYEFEDKDHCKSVLAELALRKSV